MIWNDHSELKGTHSLLSPSKQSWSNYGSENGYEELLNAMDSSYATTIGTALHAYAEERIRYKEPITDFHKGDVRIHLLKNRIPEYIIDVDKYFETLKEFINDAIEFGMDPEVTLYYSDNHYGTADAIYYDKKQLRIHDLKTGTTPAHFKQLVSYAELFFLEYGKKKRIKPETVDIELRIYQLGEIGIYHPEPSEIYDLINKAVELNEIIDIRKSGGTIK